MAFEFARLKVLLCVKCASIVKCKCCAVAEACVKSNDQNSCFVKTHAEKVSFFSFRTKAIIYAEKI